LTLALATGYVADVTSTTIALTALGRAFFAASLAVFCLPLLELVRLLTTSARAFSDFGYPDVA